LARNLQDQIDEFFADLPESLRPGAEESIVLQRQAVASYIRQLKTAIVEGLFNVKMAWAADQNERGDQILKALSDSKKQLAAAHRQWEELGGSETDPALGDESE